MSLARKTTLLLLVSLVGCASKPSPQAPPASTPSASTAPRAAITPIVVPEYVRSAVDAGDRDAEDRALDAGRRPAEMLAFFGITPGMRVAELMAGRGYTAELLARVVGPSGEVYGQNNRFILERFAEAPWSARLAKPVMKNVKRIDSELEAPLPDVRDLDAVLMVLFFHDTVWLKTDRAAMLRAIFAALKPGGVFGVVDHSARAGDGIKEVQTLHRIEESVAQSEITAAGFLLDASADFLKNPEDPRDWNPSPSQAGERRGTSDRFVLRFVKPKR